MKKQVPMNDPFLTELFSNMDEVQKLGPVTPPHLQQFKHLVDTTILRERRKMIRDVLLFLMTATLIAGLWIFEIQVDLQVFMWFLMTVSILSIIGTSIGLIWYRVTKVRSL